MRLPSLQFHSAGLVSDQRGANPQIVFVLGQQVPAQNGKLPRNGNGGDLMAPPGADADEESMQRSSRLGSRPGRFHQHRTGMAATDLADTAMVSRAQTRLTNPRVQSEVAHQLLRALESTNVADRCHQPGGDCEIHPRDRDQSLDCLIVQRALGDLPLKKLEILAEPIELSNVLLDGEPLVIRQGLTLQPIPAATVEQIGMRTERNQVSVEDRMHLVLDPRPMSHDLIAPRHQPAHPLGGGVRCPDLWQVARGVETGKRAGVDLVRLHMRVCDRLHLQGVGDDHPRNQGRQHPRDCHGITCRLDHHLVRCLEAPAEALQARTSHINAAAMP